MKDYKTYFALSILGTIFFAFGTSATAYVIKPVLDEIFVTKNINALYILPFFVVFIFAIKGLGRFMGTYFASYIGSHIVHRLRSDMLGVLLKYDLKLFFSTQKGELISRISSDTSRISGLVSTAIPTIIREFFTSIGLLGIVIYQSPKLAFFALIVMPSLAIPLAYLAKRMKRFSHKSQDLNATFISRLNEIFHNIEIIKAFNGEVFEYKRFKKDSEEFFKVAMKMVKTNELISPIMELFGAIGVATVIIVGGKEVIQGSLSVGTFFSFITALFMIYTPIKSLLSQYNQLQDAVAASERIFEYLSLKPSIVGGNLELTEKITSVEFKNIDLFYENTQALFDINLTNNCEILALVGASGGGKSSMANLLLRFYEAKNGSILINGKDIKNFSLKSVREQIAYVSQRVFIFADSVAANVAYAKEIDETKIKEALKKANALDFVNALPDGIYTKLEESGTNLSGGQKQRISIARAIYKNAQIIILDEATSALDNKSEKLIQDAISHLCENKVTFVIAHRLSTIKIASKIALLKDGKCLCVGSEKELLENCLEYQKLKELS